MARRKQVFEAPGEDEDMPLPIEESPWHFGRCTYIPSEHWEVIIEFAKDKMPSFGELLEEASYLEADYSDGNWTKWNNQKTQKLKDGLKQLCVLISQSEPLTPEVTEEILENHPPEAHIKMIKAVIAVICESQRMNQLFDSYVDS